MGHPSGLARAQAPRVGGDRTPPLERLQDLEAMVHSAKQTAEGSDWYLLCPRMRKDRADRLREYAADHFEPVLKAYPELKGKVHLALRKHGWFAQHKPVLHVIVREEDLDGSSTWRIRSITAHELMHLVQYLHGIGIDTTWNKTIERQATFGTFARGFADDFLGAFPAECTRHPCDHRFVFGYFRCDGVFRGCCRDLTEASLGQLARRLELLAQGYDSWEPLDFVGLISDCLVANDKPEATPGHLDNPIK